MRKLIILLLLSSCTVRNTTLIKTEYHQEKTQVVLEVIEPDFNDVEAHLTGYCKKHLRFHNFIEHREFIERVSDFYNIEPAFASAVIAAESCFKIKARSRAGARGLMQLMPGTARLMGVKNAYDAEDNITGGVRYLAKLNELYSGNKRLILAGYNAGPGRVRKYGYRVPPYRETRRYVKNVLIIYQMFSEAYEQVRESEEMKDTEPNDVSILARYPN